MAERRPGWLYFWLTRKERQQDFHEYERQNLGTYWRLRLEHMYGVDMSKWPNEVGVQLKRTTHWNRTDHTSYHEYQAWLESEGWEVVMTQNTLQEGRFVRLRRKQVLQKAREAVAAQALDPTLDYYRRTGSTVFITPWLVPNYDRGEWDLPDILPHTPPEVRQKLEQHWNARWDERGRLIQ